MFTRTFIVSVFDLIISFLHVLGYSVLFYVFIELSLLCYLFVYTFKLGFLFLKI